MSIIDYQEYKVISYENPSFKALIMAAMAKADTDNLRKLQEAFPDVWAEMLKRYNAPGGALDKQELDYVTRLQQEMQEA
jgi:hypothetical protein